MPNFRFETISGGRSSVIEEELASVDLASPRALELAKAALSTDRSDADHSGSHVKVYDEAGYLVATVNFSDAFEDGGSGQSDAPIESPARCAPASFDR